MITTVPEAPSLATVRRARSVRRAGATLLVLFVLAGAIGVFGTRTATKATEAGGYRLSVTYPSDSRPGHAVRFKVALQTDGVFPDPIRIRMRSQYFDLFDENAFDPDAESQTTDATYSYFEFAPPDGTVFLISSDTRVEPSRQRGESGEVSVVDAQGRPIATVAFSTRIWP